MNFISGAAVKTGDGWSFRHSRGEEMRIPAESTDAMRLLAERGEGQYLLGFRPEDAEAVLDTGGADLVCTSSVLETLGSDDYLAVESGDGRVFNVRVPAQKGFPLDVPVGLRLRRDRVHLFENQGDDMSFRGVALGKMPDAKTTA